MDNSKQAQAAVGKTLINVVTVIGIVCIAIIVLLVVNSLVKSQTQTDIDQCINTAYEKYTQTFNNYCKANGIEFIDGKCTIPSVKASELKEEYQKDKELCVTRYK